MGMGGGSLRMWSTELLRERVGTAGRRRQRAGRRKACAKALRQEEGRQVVCLVQR